MCLSVVPRKSRADQAQEPYPAFPSLLQLIPARSGPRSLALLLKGSERVPSIQEASQGSYSIQESFLVSRDVPRSSLGPCAPSAHRNCAQEEKQYVQIDWKSSKFNIYFFYLTFKKLMSCFYIYVIGSQPSWISTSCQSCLFTNCISCQPYWFYNFIQLL